MKEKDWLVANINNPDFSYSQFKEAGLTMDNTQLLTKEEYKNSKYIQDKFTDEDGKFNEVAFDKVYDTVSKTYNTFVTDSYNEKLLDTYKYSKDDPNAKPGQTKEFDFAIETIFNPDRLQTGISRTNVTDDRRFTASELAQTQKVFNYETQEFEDYTPNDNVLFKNPSGWFKSLTEPLVMAAYDEDGTHIDPLTGKEVKHVKGDLKINENGTYYMETLSGRSPAGKQIKSIFDSITDDMEKSNKYDFLDSDGLDKSVTGSIVKSAFILAPALFPEVYAPFLIGVALMDIIPTLYYTSFGLKEENPLLNTMQGMSRSFKGSVSEYSQRNAISTENFCNLISDVVLQLITQRYVQQSAVKIMGGNDISKTLESASSSILERVKNMDSLKGIPTEIIEAAVKNKKYKELLPLLDNKQKVASRISLGYMAMISGAETYETAIDAGFSEAEAAILSWGTMAGMYAVDTIGVGDWMFDELTPDAKIIQNTAKALGSRVKQAFGEIKHTGDKRTWLYSLFDKGRKLSSNYWNDLRTHSLNFVGKSLAEGLEEVSEEAVSDLAKGTFNLLSELGYTSNENAKFDIFSDMGVRYGMNFFGGIVGGTIYQGHDLLLNGKRPSKNTTKDLIYIIQNGKTKEFLEEVDRQEKEGLLGNTTLGIDQIKHADGSVSYTSAKSPEQSQNAAVANVLRNQMKVLQGILTEENLNLSEDELIKQTIARDIKLQWLINNKDYYVSNLLNDFNELTTNIVELRQLIDSNSTTLTDTQQRALERAGVDPNLELKAKLDELRKRRDSLLSGELSQYYVGEAIAGISGILNPFINVTFRNYAEYQTRQKYEDIAPDKLESLKEKYRTYQQSQQKQDLRDAYNMFLEFNKKYSQYIVGDSEKYSNIASVRNTLFDLFIDFDKTENLGKEDNVEERRTLDPIFNTEKISGKLDVINNIINNIENIDIETREAITKYLNIAFESINNSILKDVETLKTQLQARGIPDSQTFEYYFEGFLNDSTLIPEIYKAEVENFIGDNLTSEEQTLFDNIINARVIKDNINKLSSKVTTIQNPIYELLRTVGSSMYGKGVTTVFSLLEDEEKKLQTVTNVSEYFLTDDKVRDLSDAANVMAMVNSIIQATQNFDSSNIFTNTKGLEITGLNNTLNQFNGDTKFGEVDADRGELLRKELRLIEAKINYLIGLSNQNIANQVSAHIKTEEKINSIIVETLTDSQGLSQLNYKGTKLISDNLPLTGNKNDDAMIILDNIYDNFQKIKNDNPNITTEAILEEIFSNITAKFNKDSLVNQTNSRFNKETASLTDYDWFNLILSSIAFKQSDFNYHLKSIIDNNELEFAPFYAQSYAAKMALSIHINPAVMNFGINKLKEVGNDPSIAALYNTSFINGIGGAGKTAVARMVQLIAKKIDNKIEIWKVAPGETQLTNLDTNLGKEGKSFTIDDLVKLVIDPELVSDINNKKADSKFYEEVSHGNKMILKIKDGIKFNSSNNPNIVFIDEATFLNSIYAQFLSQWASENNVTIILIGDNYQNGSRFTIGNANVYNIDTGDVYMVRTPKLDISMRISNIYKKENTDKLHYVLDIMQKCYDGKATLDEVKTAINSLTLESFTDESILNGENLVKQLVREDIEKLLAKGSVGYIYDDKTSDTYKLIQTLKSEGKDIKIYTPEEVQGSEADFFIVDVKVNKDGSDERNKLYNSFVNFYTLVTRSKIGTYIIDKDVSNLIKPESWILKNKSVPTPDRSKAIEQFKIYKIIQLVQQLQNYTPSVKPSKEEGRAHSETKPVPKPTIIPPSTLVGDLLNEIQVPTVEVDPKVEGVRAYNFYMRSGLERIEINGKTYYRKTDDTTDLNILLKSKTSINRNNLRSNFNNTKNLNKDEQQLLIESGFRKKAVTEISDSLLKDLKKAGIKSFKDLYDSLQLYDENEIKTAKQALYKIKTYLANNKPFDAELKKWLADQGFNINLDNGVFKIKVKALNKNVDYPLDKLNTDLTTFKEPVMISLVYQANGKEITMGVLSRPDTWLDYINKLPDSKEKEDMKIRQTAYQAWWDSKLKLVERNQNVIDYTNVKNIRYNKLTRLVNIGSDKELIDFDKENPNIIHSSLYIYAGKGELNRSNRNKILELPDSLKGRAIMFVCSDLDAEVDGEKVTKENIARLYLKQKELSKKDPFAPKPIRFIVCKPKSITIDQYLDINKLKYDIKNKKKFLSTIGNSYTSAKILIHLWNWRANLIKFHEKIETYKRENNISELSTRESRKGFNKWLKEEEGSWAKGYRNFQLMEDETIDPDAAPGLSLVNVADEGKNSRFETVITEQVANAQLQILDKIFEEVEKLIDLSKFERSRLINIKDQGSTFLDSILDTDGTNMEVTYEDENGNLVSEKIPAFDYGSAYKLTRLLTNIYRMSKGGTTHLSKFKTKNAKGEEVEVNVYKLVGELLEIAENTVGLTSENVSKLPSTIENLFKLCIDGKIKGNKNTRSYAPFTNGIPYNPVYSHEDENAGDFEDFYLAGNSMSQFTYNTAVELPTIDIDADFEGTSSTQPDSDITLGRVRTLYDEIEIAVNARHLSLPKELNDIYNITTDPTLSAMDKIAKMASEFNNKIAPKIIENIEKDNKEVVLEYRMSDDGSPIYSFVGTLVLEWALTPSKNNDTKLIDSIINDISTIKRNSTNNDQFIVTLQDQTELVFNLNGNKLELVKVSKPSNNTNIFTITINNNGNIPFNEIRETLENAIESDESFKKVFEGRLPKDGENELKLDKTILDENLDALIEFAGNSDDQILEDLIIAVKEARDDENLNCEL